MVTDGVNTSRSNIAPANCLKPENLQVYSSNYSVKPIKIQWTRNRVNLDMIYSCIITFDGAIAEFV